MLREHPAQTIRRDLRMGICEGKGPGVYRQGSKGQLVFNSIMHVLNAAVDGVGLAYVPEELVAPYLADGRLD
jgi:DNA-binding transcriptional LysR family regulator